MTASVELLCEKLSLMIKDQRGYTPEQFYEVLYDLMKEVIDASSS